MCRCGGRIPGFCLPLCAGTAPNAGGACLCIVSDSSQDPAPPNSTSTSTRPTKEESGCQDDLFLGF